MLRLSQYLTVINTPLLLPLCYPIDLQMKVLTQLGIAKLKATSLRRELPDGGMTGLYLIVQPSGSKSFALR